MNKRSDLLLWKMERKSIFVVIFSIVILAFALFPSKSFSATASAISNNGLSDGEKGVLAATVVPTYVCLGSCPTDATSTTSPAPTAISTASNTITTAPTKDPCLTYDAAIGQNYQTNQTEQRQIQTRHRNRTSGAISGIMGAIIEFIKKLLEMIMSLIGGGGNLGGNLGGNVGGNLGNLGGNLGGNVGGNIGNLTPTNQVTNSPTAKPNPCSPTKAPVATTAPQTSSAPVPSGTTSPSASPSTCPSTATLTAGETTRTLNIGGTSRNYILHIPSGYTGKSPVPFLIDFHPLTQTATFEKGNSGYLAKSNSEGFIVAFPNGINNTWNLNNAISSSGVDDFGFVKAIVADVKTNTCIDSKRIYAAGFSMGGGMSHFLACNAADIFAATAPNAFDLTSGQNCAPARPISVLTTRGTADAIVAYGGNGVFLGAVASFKKWGEINKCTDTPAAADSNNCQFYKQCAANVSVGLCTQQGGGHATGNANIGWEFLKAHPMP